MCADGNQARDSNACKARAAMHRVHAMRVAAKLCARNKICTIVAMHVVHALCATAKAESSWDTAAKPCPTPAWKRAKPYVDDDKAGSECPARWTACSDEPAEAGACSAPHGPHSQHPSARAARRRHAAGLLGCAMAQRRSRRRWGLQARLPLMDRLPQHRVAGRQDDRRCRRL